MRSADRRSLSGLVAVVGLALSAIGCGGDGDAVPTTDELVARAVTAADLGSDWAGSAESAPRVIAEADRGDLAAPDLCPDVSDDARRRVDDLAWQVGSGAGYTAVEGDRIPSLVVVLLAADDDVVTETFDLLRDGMTDCLPTEFEFADAGVFAASVLDVPDVGDDRFGVRYQQTDQPGGADRWDRRDVVVRSGTVLMWFSAMEITTGEPALGDAAFEAALVAAADRMSGDAETTAATVPTTTPTQIANPASVFCVEQGGTVEIVDEAGGQLGYCLLPDGRRIEEWEFFRSSTTVPPSEP